MQTTAIVPKQDTSAATTQGDIAHAEPVMLRKRIGSTNYVVNVHFSDKSKETIEDKILRLIEREVNKIA